MPSKTLKTFHRGIRIVELKRKLWHGKPDRVYFARITIGGVRHERRLGADSDGWTLESAVERRDWLIEELNAGRLSLDSFCRVGGKKMAKNEYPLKADVTGSQKLVAWLKGVGNEVPDNAEYTVEGKQLLSRLRSHYEVVGLRAHRYRNGKDERRRSHVFVEPTDPQYLVPFDENREIPAEERARIKRVADTLKDSTMATFCETTGKCKRWYEKKFKSGKQKAAKQEPVVEEQKAEEKAEVEQEVTTQPELSSDLDQALDDLIKKLDEFEPSLQALATTLFGTIKMQAAHVVKLRVLEITNPDTLSLKQEVAALKKENEERNKATEAKIAELMARVKS